MATDHELERLAFIRELYRRASETSTEPEPLAAMSVLGFHDAVELFLHLSATHLNAKVSGQTQFAAYFELIDAKLPDRTTLEGRSSMLQLNQARVGLKHHGIVPAHLSIEGHRATTTAFLEANTPLVFDGVQLSDLDRAQLVTFPETRARLETCAALSAVGEIEEALREAAIAFAVMKVEFRERSGTKGYRGWASISSPSVDDDNVESALASLADQVEGELERLEGMIEHLALGFDLLRWERFAVWTPRAYNRDGEWVTAKEWSGARRRSLDVTHVDYCRDFVIDSALRLQALAV